MSKEIMFNGRMHRQLSKKEIKLNEFVLIGAGSDFQVAEVIINDFTNKVVLDNCFGQIGLEEWLNFGHPVYEADYKDYASMY